jgi:hypothetical protein
VTAQSLLTGCYERGNDLRLCPPASLCCVIYVTVLAISV